MIQSGAENQNGDNTKFTNKPHLSSSTKASRKFYFISVNSGNLLEEMLNKSTTHGCSASVAPFSISIMESNTDGDIDERLKKG
ncbi:uncharacterized protein PHALS_03468 [Plasmopara halstedii]|uniref:Uncharacterized protein n=1 Tax=Plasmopara halstedii TaxID=4781 RepID=A0A0N7L7D7_PLAHL|nr:uncharacterized protein PHALS_03468 [Plasmopara halstedii]CEG46787.1 hypothetical protein PHALS_03468 [Plasmopara halstedii]|eukprot:XP_024583156.1 hypothetical protein PHALS_03468 [Plasmopara halstedii]